MNQDKSKTMDAAEKLMLDLMEKHPGASESSLLTLFQNVARERPEVLRAIVGHFMKHSSVQERLVIVRFVLGPAIQYTCANRAPVVSKQLPRADIRQRRPDVAE